MYLWKPYSHSHHRACWCLSWPCHQVSVWCVCACRWLSGTFHTITKHKTHHWGEIISFRYSLTVCQHAFPATDWLADFVSWVFSSILVNVLSSAQCKTWHLVQQAGSIKKALLTIELTKSSKCGCMGIITVKGVALQVRAGAPRSGAYHCAQTLDSRL